ncbi:MAG: glycogen synthase GlgA [Hydrogenophilales bacterium]|nr:glycogen synthase GlgA [Hydrogenophilales bacterium]
MTPSSPKILFATSEAHPLIKTGGLADVSGALPAALHALGVDVKILLPGYPAVLQQGKHATPFAQLPNPFAPGTVEILETRLPETAVPVLIVRYDAFFNRKGGPYQQPGGKDWPDNALRFGLLSYVAAWLGSSGNPTAWQPDLIHCNDWQTGLAPAYLRFWPGRKPPSIMTIHNLAYQGVFGPESVKPLHLPAESFKIQGLEYYGNLSFLKAGVFYADRITTVSPTYARDIQQEALGFGMHGLLHERRSVLSGIINGIDTKEWDPQHDPHLPHRYSAKRLNNKVKNKAALQHELGLAVEAPTPLVAIISRITYQKGSDLVLGVMHDLIREGVQFALLGTGDAAIEQAFVNLARAHPGRIAVTIGYAEDLSHRMEAGADMFLMPSRYEPCGLNQMYSQRYGTPPVAHATGGLADTIVHATPTHIATGDATGFLFREMTHHACTDAVRRAVRLYRDAPLWQQLQSAGMQRDFSWQNSAEAYLKLYRSLAA